MTATVDKRRVSELKDLPKHVLIARCEASGTIDPNLARWSKFDLATEIARAEARQAVTA